MSTVDAAENEATKEDKKEEKKKEKSKNDIPILQNIQQAEKVELDPESPRLKQAMENLHLTKEDLYKKTNFRLSSDEGQDVIELRKKHFFGRYIDVINQLLVERRKIKIGRSRMQRSQTRKPSPNAKTMYKTFYKSQKHISVTSPKDKSKARVEIAIQNEENNQYKLALLENKQKDYSESKQKMLQELVELKKRKNQLKSMELKHRLDMHQTQIEKEIQEFSDELKKKDIQKQEYERMMNEKREQLKHKDEQFRARRDKLFRKIQEMEERLISDGQAHLEQIEEKCKKGQDIRFKVIKRRASAVQKRNDETQKRLEQYYTTEEQRKKEQEKKYLEQRLKAENKIESHFRETKKRQDEIRLKHRIKSESSLVNRRGENNDVMQKLEKVMDKLQQSEDTVSKFKEQKEHEFYLKRELRRLKEEDFRKLKERQKRIEFLRKLEILGKEKEHEDYIKRNRSQLELFKKKKVEKTMKTIMMKEQLISTMVNINSRRMSPKQKKMFLQSQNLELNVNFLESPKKKKKTDDEDGKVP